MMISWAYIGDIVPKGRPRVYGGHAFTPKRTVTFEKAFRAFAKLALGREHGTKWPLDRRYCVEIHISPKTSRRTDLDNQVKSILDALNGIMWKDDSQVDVIIVRRFWTYKGMANIHVISLGDPGPVSKKDRKK